MVRPFTKIFGSPFTPANAAVVYVTAAENMNTMDRGVTIYTSFDLFFIKRYSDFDFIGLLQRCNYCVGLSICKVDEVNVNGMAFYYVNLVIFTQLIRGSANCGQNHFNRVVMDSYRLVRLKAYVREGCTIFSRVVIPFRDREVMGRLCDRAWQAIIWGLMIFMTVQVSSEIIYW